MASEKLFREDGDTGSERELPVEKHRVPEMAHLFESLADRGKSPEVSAAKEIHIEVDHSQIKKTREAFEEMLGGHHEKEAEAHDGRLGGLHPKESEAHEEVSGGRHPKEREAREGASHVEVDHNQFVEKREAFEEMLGGHHQKETEGHDGRSGRLHPKESIAHEEVSGGLHAQEREAREGASHVEVDHNQFVKKREAFEEISRGHHEKGAEVLDGGLDGLHPDEREAHENMSSGLQSEKREEQEELPRLHLEKGARDEKENEDTAEGREGHDIGREAYEDISIVPHKNEREATHQDEFSGPREDGRQALEVKFDEADQERNKANEEKQTGNQDERKEVQEEKGIMPHEIGSEVNEEKLNTPHEIGIEAEKFSGPDERETDDNEREAYEEGKKVQEVKSSEGQDEPQEQKSSNPDDGSGDTGEIRQEQFSFLPEKGRETEEKGRGVHKEESTEPHEPNSSLHEEKSKVPHDDNEREAYDEGRKVQEVKSERRDESQEQKSSKPDDEDAKTGEIHEENFSLLPQKGRETEEKGKEAHAEESTVPHEPKNELHEEQSNMPHEIGVEAQQEMFTGHLSNRERETDYKERESKEEGREGHEVEPREPQSEHHEQKSSGPEDEARESDVQQLHLLPEKGREIEDKGREVDGEIEVHEDKLSAPNDTGRKDHEEKSSPPVEKAREVHEEQFGCFPEKGREIEEKGSEREANKEKSRVPNETGEEDHKEETSDPDEKASAVHEEQFSRFPEEGREGEGREVDEGERETNQEHSSVPIALGGEGQEQELPSGLQVKERDARAGQSTCLPDKGSEPPEPETEALEVNPDEPYGKVIEVYEQKSSEPDKVGKEANEAKSSPLPAEGKETDEKEKEAHQGGQTQGVKSVLQEAYEANITRPHEEGEEVHEEQSKQEEELARPKEKGREAHEDQFSWFPERGSQNVEQEREVNQEVKPDAVKPSGPHEKQKKVQEGKSTFPSEKGSETNEQERESQKEVALDGLHETDEEERGFQEEVASNGLSEMNVEPEEKGTDILEKKSCGPDGKGREVHEEQTDFPEKKPKEVRKEEEHEAKSSRLPAEGKETDEKDKEAHQGGQTQGVKSVLQEAYEANITRPHEEGEKGHEEQAKQEEELARPDEKGREVHEDQFSWFPERGSQNVEKEREVDEEVKEANEVKPSGPHQKEKKVQEGKSSLHSERGSETNEQERESQKEVASNGLHETDEEERNFQEEVASNGLREINIEEEKGTGIMEEKSSRPNDKAKEAHEGQTCFPEKGIENDGNGGKAHEVSMDVHEGKSSEPNEKERKADEVKLSEPGEKEGEVNEEQLWEEKSNVPHEQGMEAQDEKLNWPSKEGREIDETWRGFLDEGKAAHHEETSEPVEESEEAQYVKSGTETNEVQSERSNKKGGEAHGEGLIGPDDGETEATAEQSRLLPEREIEIDGKGREDHEEFIEAVKLDGPKDESRDVLEDKISEHDDKQKQPHKDKPSPIQGIKSEAYEKTPSWADAVGKFEVNDASVVNDIDTATTEQAALFPGSEREHDGTESKNHEGFLQAMKSGGQKDESRDVLEDKTSEHDDRQKQPHEEKPSPIKDKRSETYEKSPSWADGVGKFEVNEVSRVNDIGKATMEQATLFAGSEREQDGTESKAQEEFVQAGKSSWPYNARRGVLQDKPRHSHDEEKEARGEIKSEAHEEKPNLVHGFGEATTEQSALLPNTERNRQRKGRAAHRKPVEADKFDEPDNESRDVLEEKPSHEEVKEAHKQKPSPLDEKKSKGHEEKLRGADGVGKFDVNNNIGEATTQRSSLLSKGETKIHEKGSEAQEGFVGAMKSNWPDHSVFEEKPKLSHEEEIKAHEKKPSWLDEVLNLKSGGAEEKGGHVLEAEPHKSHKNEKKAHKEKPIKQHGQKSKTHQEKPSSAHDVGKNEVRNAGEANEWPSLTESINSLHSRHHM